MLHWHDLENPSDGDRVPVTKMQIYDKYNSNTMDGDVCVLTLASPTAYTPIVLDGGSTTQAGEVNIAAGWGNTSPTGSAFPALAATARRSLGACGVGHSVRMRVTKHSAPYGS